uniref:Uncharacterized protein n=1 Tax=viral metagenome TaxID=1070528 RepID=A0A6C0CBW4_9ZZZZ
MSIKFYQDVDNELKVIDSAELHEKEVGDFVAERGLQSEMMNNISRYFVPWKLFLELVRDTMVEGQQEMDPDFMQIVDTNDQYVNIYMPIKAIPRLVTANDGIINIVPDALLTPDEEKIVIDFITKPVIETFSINNDDTMMIHNVLFVCGLLLIMYIIYRLSILN